MTLCAASALAGPRSAATPVAAATTDAPRRRLREAKAICVPFQSGAASWTVARADKQGEPAPAHIHAYARPIAVVRSWRWCAVQCPGGDFHRTGAQAASAAVCLGPEPRRQRPPARTSDPPSASASRAAALPELKSTALAPRGAHGLLGGHAPRSTSARSNAGGPERAVERHPDGSPPTT